MLNLLIVDDDSIKIQDIFSIIKEFSEIPQENIEYVLEVKQAIHKLQVNQYDLVIIDIKLPNELGSKTIDNGGIDLLSCIHSMDRIKKPSHILGLTSHDQSMEEHQSLFSDYLWGLLKYDKKSDEWKEQIKKKVSYLIKWKRNFVDEMPMINEERYDFAIITAVEREYKSVLDLKMDWKPIIVQNDSTRYKEGIIKTKDKDQRVIVAKLPQMGMPASAVLSMKLINNFKPRYLCMLGIAAGKRGRTELGDILIATESWDYGSGKIREDGSTESKHFFEPEPHNIPIESGIKETLMQDFSEILFKIRQEWNKTSPEEIKTDIKVRTGPVASGSSVIQDETIVKEFIDPLNRKLVGLDMETYAVYYSASNCQAPRPIFLSMKSVCDFADEEKHDNYQVYASYTSAQFFYHLVSNSILT